MAIKTPAELKKEAEALIAQRNEAEQKLQEKRLADTARRKEEAERHVAEVANQMEASVQSLVTLAIAHDVKHVIIGKFNYQGDSYGRFDWMADEDEGILASLRRKLPEIYRLQTADVAVSRFKEGEEKVLSVQVRHGSGRDAHGTIERWLMPAKLLSTKSVEEGNKGHYLVLSWD